MSSTISLSALLLLVSAALIPPAVPRPTTALPQAVLAHPAADATPTLQAQTPGWFPRALATWGGPQPPPREGMYDERYITW
jgi:hypothetical protein